MNVLPSPLVIWGMSFATLALGLRARRLESGNRGRHDTLPATFQIAARLPVPDAWVSFATTERLAHAAIGAGFDPRVAVATVARARIALALLSLVAGVALLPLGLAAVVVGSGGSVVGYVGPAHWITRRAKVRRQRILHGLPDLIDLVVICTTAGMALEFALRTAASRMSGPLADEVHRTLRSIDLGVPRREAYTGVARRVDVAELTGLVGAILQAEELGAPIAGVLARQAELLRLARKQDIRDHAAKAAPKVQLVVAMIMVPAALMVILGVMFIHLIGEIGGVVGPGA